MINEGKESFKINQHYFGKVTEKQLATFDDSKLSKQMSVRPKKKNGKLAERCSILLFAENKWIFKDAYVLSELYFLCIFKFLSS